MERDLRLKQFASSLFSSLYKDYNTSFEFPVKLPLLPVESEAGCSDEEKRAVMKICLSLRTIFNGVFVKAFPQIQRSVKHFMTFLTSRCLKLCDEEDLFMSFVIICAFIAELNLFCCANGSYAYLSTAPRCLSAIFHRRLRREFYACGGWERLHLFCENFIQMNGRSYSEHINGDGGIPSQSTVQKIQHLLEQNSSSEDEETTSSDSSSEEMVEDEESIEEHVSADSDESDSSESSESEDSELEEDSEEDSSEEEEELKEMPIPKLINATRTIESDDDESETSEDSDPSSMTEEEASESDSDEESQLDPTLNPSQTNSLTPIMQENLSVEKKLL